jgi:hypothetical protein
VKRFTRGRVAIWQYNKNFDVFNKGLSWFVRQLAMQMSLHVTSWCMIYRLKFFKGGAWISQGKSPQTSAMPFYSRFDNIAFADVIRDADKREKSFRANKFAINCKVEGSFHQYTAFVLKTHWITQNPKLFFCLLDFMNAMRSINSNMTDLFIKERKIKIASLL